MRVGFRTLVSLALCAAAAGAALAHVAIDVVGDYALDRDSYDHLRHGSRELVTGFALVVAAMLAVRGLRVCCEIAQRNRGSLARPMLGLPELLGALGTAVAASVVAVPAMELFDGRLDGVAVTNLADAFGGSIALGVATTILCAALVASVVYGLALWLISHRDSIATIIETLLRRIVTAPPRSAYDLATQRFIPNRCALPALRLAKRGPPVARFA